jgi:hypothetical protein
VSSLDSQLIDGNFNSLCYNNTVTGTTDLNFVGVDLGSNQDVDYINIYWFSSEYTGDFRIETSQDGVNWTDRTGVITGTWQGDNEEPEIITLPESLNTRYIRPVVINGNNATYFVINELEIYKQNETINYVLVGTSSNDNIQTKLVDNKLYITNNHNYDVEIKISYI